MSKLEGLMCAQGLTFVSSSTPFRRCICARSWQEQSAASAAERSTVSGSCHLKKLATQLRTALVSSRPFIFCSRISRSSGHVLATSIGSLLCLRHGERTTRKTSTSAPQTQAPRPTPCERPNIQTIVREAGADSTASPDQLEAPCIGVPCDHRRHHGELPAERMAAGT